jgi:hypothetical protein
MDIFVVVLLSLITLGIGILVLNLLYITFILFKFHQTFKSSLTLTNEKIDTFANVYIGENEKLAKWIRELVINNG